MPSVERPPNHQEPDNNQAVIERQVEIIADLQNTVKKERQVSDQLRRHIEACAEEIKKGDRISGWMAAVATAGWLVVVYLIAK